MPIKHTIVIKKNKNPISTLYITSYCFDKICYNMIMADEIDPNLRINSDLFTSFSEGFTEEEPEAIILCCDACICTTSHSSIPIQES
jgi:hypothetical protein